MTGLDPTLALVLDPGRLAAVVGRDELAVLRLRHKPGLDTLAAVTVTHGAVEWVRISHDGARAARDVHRAGARRTTTRHAGVDLHVTTGSAAADPALAPAWRDAADAGYGTALDGSDHRLLRYNPGRRLVFRTDGEVVRLHARPPADPRPLADVARAADVSMAGTTPLTPHLHVGPWVGHSDLAVSPSPDAARRAGRLLADLHRLDAATPPYRTSAEVIAAARRCVDGLAPITPGLAARARSLVGRIHLPPPARCSTLHGDFSADQVAVDADGNPTLLDLDRAARGDARIDLGSFLAVDALRTGTVHGATAEALLTGWSDAEGTPVEDLRPFVAAAIATRLSEPMRRAAPDWHDRIAASVDLLAEVTS